MAAYFLRLARQRAQVGEQGEVYHLLCNLIFEVTYYHFAIRSQSLGPAHIQGHGYQESGILRGCFRGYPPQCYCLTDLYKSFYLKYYLLATSTIILVVILVYHTYILTVYYLSKLNFPLQWLLMSLNLEVTLKIWNFTLILFSPLPFLIFSLSDYLYFSLK